MGSPFSNGSSGLTVSAVRAREAGVVVGELSKLLGLIQACPRRGRIIQIA
jgi:hypothetical protein